MNIRQRSLWIGLIVYGVLFLNARCSDAADAAAAECVDPNDAVRRYLECLKKSPRKALADPVCMPSRGSEDVYGKFTLGCFTQNNRRGPGKKPAYYNQDAVRFGSKGARCFFSLADGHGQLGDSASMAALVELEAALGAIEGESQDNLSVVLPELFATVQKKGKIHHPSFWDSGATVVAGLVCNGALTLAHAGDARAVLIRDGAIIYQTRDHKPNDPEEGSWAAEKGYDVFQVPGSSVWRFSEKCVDRQMVCSYSFTRGLGDVRSKGMIRCEPTVSNSMPFKKGDCLVMASDGVWDEVSSEDAACFVKPESSPQGIAVALVQKASQAGVTDDITALVVCPR